MASTQHSPTRQSADERENDAGRTSSPPPSTDGAQLGALGYKSDFDRSLNLRQNFAIGFTYLSPVVGAYGLFSYGISVAGPPMIWSFVIAAAGQLLTCLIFGEAVAEFPLAGGIYPWARRLGGRRWGWMAGWLYAWGMFATVAGVVTSGGLVLSALVSGGGSHSQQILISLGLLAATTAINLSGTRAVARAAVAGFIAEIAGALVVGCYLLLFHRQQPITTLFMTYNAARGGSYYHAFLSALIVGMFCCYGFEACGDVAEETTNPSVTIPKAMRMTIYVGMSVAVFACLALILAIPDMRSVVTLARGDALASILAAAFGVPGSKAIAVILFVSYISCCLSLQAAASRLLFALGRDRMLMFSGALSKLSSHHHAPTTALIVAAVIPALIISLGFWVKQLLVLVINFAAVGIYLAFQMVVLAALVARFRGWRPRGPFQLGYAAWLVNILALAYGLAAITNMLWPRRDAAPWYANNAVLLAAAVVTLAGITYLFSAQPYRHSTAPAADAAAR